MHVWNDQSMAFQSVLHICVQVSDLGITQYPKYSISRHMAAFPSRQALLDYELALRQGTALDTAFEASCKTLSNSAVNSRVT